MLWRIRLPLMTGTNRHLVDRDGFNSMRTAPVQCRTGAKRPPEKSQSSPRLPVTLTQPTILTSGPRSRPTRQCGRKATRLTLRQDRFQKRPQTRPVRSLGKTPRSLNPSTQMLLEMPPNCTESWPLQRASRPESRLVPTRQECPADPSRSAGAAAASLNANPVLEVRPRELSATSPSPLQAG